MRMPTLLYFAGVPGDLPPAMRTNLTEVAAPAAGASAAHISTTARGSKKRTCLIRRRPCFWDHNAMAKIEVLPRAPHASVREELRASQRGRLICAVADCVAAKGYAETTVADVIALAGVSRKTFYEHFTDKEACFLASYDHGADAIHRAMLEAAEGPGLARDPRLRARHLARVPRCRPRLHARVHDRVLGRGRRRARALDEARATAPADSCARCTSWHARRTRPSSRCRTRWWPPSWAASTAW